VNGCRTRMLTVVLAGWTAVLSAGCHSAGRVTNQVLEDFGLRRRSAEDEPSVEVKIRQRMNEIAVREMRRLTNSPESSRIVFVPIPNHPLGTGTYYKERRVYDRYYILDVTKRRRSGQGSPMPDRRGAADTYTVTVDYRCRVYRTHELATHDAARAGRATVLSEQMGYEQYKYTFDSHGEWDGKPGRLVK